MPGLGLAAAATNKVTGEVNTNMRWMRLYRKIYNLFLWKDMAHKKDFETTIDILNKRIEELETNLSAYATQTKLDHDFLVNIYNSHTHTGSGTGVVPGLPPVIIPVTITTVVPVPTSSSSTATYNKTVISSDPLEINNFERDQEVYAWPDDTKPLPVL
jgi:hypothetical protein